jgi:hypothetical protein
MILEGAPLPVACAGLQCPRAIYTVILRGMKAWACRYIFYSLTGKNVCWLLLSNVVFLLIFVRCLESYQETTNHAISKFLNLC